VLALPAPDKVTLGSLGLDPDKFRNENPRCAATAVAFTVAEGPNLYGVSKTIVVENGLRMGSSDVVLLEDQWTESLEELEDLLLPFYFEAISLRIGPEPGSPAWRTVVALLGGSNKGDDLPDSWQREMRIAAGLRALDLRISPSPEAARVSVVQDLRERPPDALLVWVNWVAHPESFITPYLAARPDAYAEVLGSRDHPTEYAEDLSELVMHLREIAPLTAVSDIPVVESVTWDAVLHEATQMIGPHFRLTERALAKLKGNAYRDPGRMLAHLRSLADLASAYNAAKGQIGGRLSDVAISEYGIEVALYDSSLMLPAISIRGNDYYARHHVKVDDFKSPDRCGRIYFCIDDEFCFVVDHVGLHDYGN
jgi:hypothetical protein